MGGRVAVVDQIFREAFSSQYLLYTLPAIWLRPRKRWCLRETTSGASRGMQIWGASV